MSEIDELFEALEEAREADQVASACVIYEEILTLDDVEDAAQTLLYIRDLVDLGNFGQAEATLDRVFELVDQENQHFWYWTKGTFCEETGDFAEAESSFRKAHKCSSQRGDYLVQAASMAFRQGESAKAEYLVREALKLPCEKDEALSNLGGYLASQRRFEEARATFQEVLAIDARNEHAHEWLEDLGQLLPD